MTRLAPFAALALAAGACGDQGGAVTGFEPDRQPPRVTLAGAEAPSDTSLALTVTVTDNLDLSRVQVDVTGGLTASVDTTITATTTAFAMPLTFGVSRGVAPGTPVRVVARARDGAGNVTTSDTLHLAVGNLKPPAVAVTAPAPGTLFVVGKAGTMTLVATAPLKVSAVGYRTTGSFVSSDSTVFAGAPLRDSVAVVDTLAVPATAGSGVLTVTPFVRDSSGNEVSGPSIAFAVATAAAVDSRPVVTAAFHPRLEVTDTVRVSVTDPAGLQTFGYEVVARDSVSGDSVIVARDSVASNGALTTVSHRFTLALPATSVGLPVRLKAFATNTGGRRAYAEYAGGVARADSALVVAGTSHGLPNGGRLADAIYVPRFDRLYLTNIERNRLEVFGLANRAFLSGVDVGSRPWGIAAWPRTRAGEMGDTLLVANSGGTNVSYVDLRVGGSGREVSRYALPNIVAYSVTSEKSAETGVSIPVRRVYDFSDRPQFVATTCTGGLTPGAACEDPILVYSTTPTPGQTLPFPNRGTMRWENLRTRASHFFFEQAVGQSAGRSDTLEIMRFAAGGVGSDSLLVKYLNKVLDANGDTAMASVVVDVSKLAFRDTTYVRNSGTFRRSIIGEGGNVLGSRAVMYDVTMGFEPGFTDVFGRSYRWVTPMVDRGISRATDVSDYIANAYASVKGVAINFDGALAGVRADSTYIIDPTLRLQGLLQTTGGSNAGFDFHPQNATGNSTLSTRFAFSASTLPQIEVYDTHCYQRVATIQVREPIIGPIKASLRGGSELVVVGASAHGVIVVPITRPLTTSCP